jgi:uncharacterized coiled-coil protein SlyX
LDDLWNYLYGGGGIAIGVFLLKTWQIFRKSRQDDWTYLSDQFRKLLKEKDDAIAAKELVIEKTEQCLDCLEQDMADLKEKNLRTKVKLAEAESRLAAYEKHPGN